MVEHISHGELLNVIWIHRLGATLAQSFLNGFIRHIGIFPQINFALGGPASGGLGDFNRARSMARVLNHERFRTCERPNCRSRGITTVTAASLHLHGIYMKVIKTRDCEIRTRSSNVFFSGAKKELSDLISSGL
jgi:hypothetical protein